MGGPCCNQKSEPFVFDEFFESNRSLRVSPFLKPAARRWSSSLPLKASILAALLLVISFTLSFWTSYAPLAYLMLLLVYVLAGIPSLIEAIEDVLDLEINIDILMTLAAFSSVFIGNGFEGGLLLVLFNLSGAMEQTVTSKALGALHGLHKLAPTKAAIITEDGKVRERSVKDIRTGTLILIRSGETIPLDGTITEGASNVNMVHLTGESTPIPKREGDEVAAGSQVIDGALTVRVSHTSADSTLARIIRLITEAQESRPGLQRWFSQISRAYALSIIGLSTTFALSLPLLINIPLLGPEGSVYRALAFLIAASPCALILAIPISYLSALSSCARRGILLKGGITLDALANSKSIAFDKTGTLTTGELICTEIEYVGKDTAVSASLISIAAALERNSAHPMARAITHYAEESGIALSQLDNFTSIPGYGLEADVSIDGRSARARIGHADFILSKLTGDSHRALQSQAEIAQRRGEPLAVLHVDTDLVLFHFQDEIRSEMGSTIQALQTRGYTCHMLTGDHRKSAEEVAKELRIDSVHAELRPEDKLTIVSDLSANEGLAMVGDGINDAPALARATVGVAMGAVGSATAIEASDVVLMQDNIEQLDWLLSRAQFTQRIVKQNLVFAASAIIVAAIPALGGFIPLWLAVIMHEGGTVLVGLNGLRLLR